MSAQRADIVPFGERGWLATFTDSDDPVASGLAANYIADNIRGAAGVDDVTAGVNSIVLRFDPQRLNPDTARMMLEKEIRDAPDYVSPPAGDPVVIPVFYGGEAGPDLADIAAQAKLPVDAVIAAHSSKTYRVATLGFAPGFAYLGALDSRLRVKRLTTPRVRVPAGSVGVSGDFTCIYPLPSPGGWRLIGRTPTPLFDPSADEPFLLTPGETVQFRPMSAAEYEAQA